MSSDESPPPPPRRALIMGGSLAGLNAALWLRHAGYDVAVLERSPRTLTGRGAGILLNPVTVAALQHRNASFDLNAISVPIGSFRYLPMPPSPEIVLPTALRFTSYNALLAAYSERLAELQPGPAYRFGKRVVAINQTPGDDLIHVRTASGEQFSGHLLVCADGAASEARSLLGIDADEQYAGYIAWRGVLPATALPAAAAAELSSYMTYHLRADSHLICYPIPADVGAEEQQTGEHGARGNGLLLNWLWYRAVPHGPQLDAVMTDARGDRRVRTVPPGLVCRQAVARLHADAQAELPPAFRELLVSTARPFVQMVSDSAVPRVVAGRACLVGDAAFTLRPHSAVATAKAADDAQELVAELRHCRGDVNRALLTWQTTRVSLGLDCLQRSRQLGEMLQSGSFDPRKGALLFGLHRASDSEMA